MGVGVSVSSGVMGRTSSGCEMLGDEVRLCGVVSSDRGFLGVSYC